ncbi:hypothetical protein ES707_22424 [subsurface metagenome]
MPGGNGNIRPSDNPVPFLPGNKAAEKWTQKDADRFAYELIEWLSEKFTDQEGNEKDKGNIFIIDFLAEKKYPGRIIRYLSDKFTTFRPLIEIAKNIQEAKLVKYGVADRLNASMTKFCLINHHGYLDKQHIDHTTQGQAVNDIQITVADKATIDRVKKLMNGDKPDKDI